MQAFKKIGTHAWSSCRAHLWGTVDAYLSRSTWLEDSERVAYRTMMLIEDTKTDKEIRKATSTGRPLGGAQFIQKLERQLKRGLAVKKVGRPNKHSYKQEVSLIKFF